MGFMIEEALRYARAQGLLHHGMHVLVACSGGPDSLALLDILLRLRGRLRLALTVAHFEHGIRGASSEGDDHLSPRSARSAACALLHRAR